MNALATKTDANYTRYADDLVFSGGQELNRCLPQFRVLTLAIILDEGFAIQNRKTRVMPRSRRQSVGGIVINEQPNVPRVEFDRLRAMLHNCSRHGPESQLERFQSERADLLEMDLAGMKQHLVGKIAFIRMVNPCKGERLSSLFDRIEWSE